MKSQSAWCRLCLPVILLLLLGSVMLGGAPVYAQTGSATASATPSDAAPAVGNQITVAIDVDVSGVNAPDNYLGSYTATLDWNPAVLDYHSNSGVPAGFTGVINEDDVSSGHLIFNGANASGASGNTTVLNVTFDVIGSGTSALDLEFSAMAAANTFVDLLPVLTVNDSQVVAAGGDPGGPITYVGDIGSAGEQDGGHDVGDQYDRRGDGWR